MFNNRGYRKKSPERILDELNRLPEGVEVAAFVDDEFWVDAPRSLELAGLLRQQPDDWRGKDWRFWAQVRTGDIARKPELVEKWSEVGMKVLLLGIESVKNSELKDLHNKRSNIEQAITALATMKQYGIEAWGCFIVNPEWEEEDFIELEGFVRDHEIAFPQYTVLTPLPGNTSNRRFDRIRSARAREAEISATGLLARINQNNTAAQQVLRAHGIALSHHRSPKQRKSVSPNGSQRGVIA